jgi:aryl-alcohol dehydrogenase-like predicted oxidoreductase
MAYSIARQFAQPGDDEVARMLACARSAGIDTLDTARAYGTSEEVIGRRLGNRGWTVVTKLDPQAKTGAAARASIAASRTALKRDVLDVLLLHRAAQRRAADGEVWDALRRERDGGGIHQLGVSAESPEEAWAALDDPDVECLQVATSLLDQRLSRAGFFEAARRMGRKVFVRSVFLQGVAHLAPTALPSYLDPLRPVLHTIHDWAAGAGVRPFLPFLAFAARLSDAKVLIGCEAVVQLQANLDAWATAIDLAFQIAPLANLVPPLPAAILDPSRWPAS